METPFLQTGAWEEFQTTRGRRVVDDRSDGWSYMAILEKGKLNTRLYSPYGPIVKSNDAFAEALASMKVQAKRYGASFIRVEPRNQLLKSELLQHGLHHVSHIQPEATSIIDLSPTEDELIANMAPNNRNLHRTFESKGLSLHVSHSPKHITILTNLLADVAKHTGMKAQTAAYLRKQAELFLPMKKAHLYFVSYQGEPIAAALAYDDGTTLTYAHAAADYEHRKLNASSILVSQMMIAAKKAGLKYFDLYGIWPDAEKGTSHGGITRFKRSFGGKDVVYVGTWELPVNTVAYHTYSLLRKLGQ